MGRNTTRNEELRQLSKEKILAAALNQFAEKGLFATRIQDIAEKAHISQGLLYRYYSSKDDIYVELINEALDKMSSATIDLLSMSMSGKNKIIKAIEEMYNTIETSEQYRQTSRLISEAAHSEAIPESAKITVSEQRDEPYKLFSKIIEQGQNEGDVIEGDPYELAVLFWSLINGLTIYKHTRNSIYQLPDKRFIMRMLLKSDITQKGEFNK